MDLAASNNIASANNLFAIDLYKNLIIPKKSDENGFLSPFSILAALSMVNVGAQGSTRDEILNATKLKSVFGANAGNIDSAFKEFYSTVKVHTTAEINKASTTDPADSFEGPQPSYLSLANRVYVQKGTNVKPKFGSTLKNSYNTTFGTEDFAKNPGTATQNVNKWVESVTNGKIKNLFNTFTTDTTLALASAIYFKGNWDNKFEVSKTKENNFFTSSLNSVKAKFMDAWDDESLFADFTSEFDATALMKRYAYKDIQMVVVLPNKKDGLAALEKKLSVKLFDKSQYETANVHITLPKFKIEDSYDLGSGLKAMGIKKAFTNGADFGGISDVPMKIGEAVHKSFVAVDEEGTEAAAATGIKMVLESAVWPEPQQRIFNADHSFLFAIQDTETGSLLFLGRVQKPSL